MDEMRLNMFPQVHAKAPIHVYCGVNISGVIQE